MPLMLYCHDGAVNADELASARQQMHKAQLRMRWLYLPQTALLSLNCDKTAVT